MGRYLEGRHHDIFQALSWNLCGVTEESLSEDRLWPCWYSTQASDRSPYTKAFLLQARRSTSRTFACGSIHRGPKASPSTGEPARTARGFPTSSTGELYRQVALLLSVSKAQVCTARCAFGPISKFAEVSRPYPTEARFYFILARIKTDLICALLGYYAA